MSRRQESRGRTRGSVWWTWSLHLWSLWRICLVSTVATPIHGVVGHHGRMRNGSLSGVDQVPGLRLAVIAGWRCTVSLDAGDSPVANATLSSVNAAFTLSLILTQATSPSQAIRLLTTAVPSIASCDQVLTWHPSRSGEYYEHAPERISDTLAQITVPGQLELD